MAADIAVVAAAPVVVVDVDAAVAASPPPPPPPPPHRRPLQVDDMAAVATLGILGTVARFGTPDGPLARSTKIGRASCRERVCIGV
jgi:hypothetical protein